MIPTYAVLYYFVLYPLVFFGGLLLTIPALLYELVTGRRPRLVPGWTSGAWETISQPITWIKSGRKSDKPGWVP